MNSLTILDDKASVKAAIATMHPVAKDAAQMLSNNMLDNPAIMSDDKTVEQEWKQCIAFAASRAGMNPEVNAEKFDDFVENHGQSVLNVAVSIVHLTEKEKKWGWVKKAAAVGVGVVIGSLFG